MGSIIIDRRLNNKDASIVNRERYIKRHEAEIRNKIYKTIQSNDSVQNQDHNVQINITTHEPTFHFDYNTGEMDFIVPGNDLFMTGDKIPLEMGGGSGGSGSGSGGSGQGEDDFIFNITEEEYLDILFEGMSLPNVVKMSNGTDLVDRYRSGFQNTGAQLDMKATFKKSIMRRSALELPLLKKKKELEEQIANESNEENLVILNNSLTEIVRKLNAVCFIDDVDVKYRRYDTKPVPMSKVVMFFVMDVSGSMTQDAKEKAKRFFLLSYLFLKRMYQKHEIVFITFTDEAMEVDEDKFFHDTRSGGTLFSSGLSLTKEIIEERYNLNEWNIYTIMLSDSDNMTYDKGLSLEYFNSLIAINQFFIYGHVSTFHDNPERAYEYREELSHHSNFAFTELSTIGDIFHKFKSIFTRIK
jgi:uncharacterized sporulation protein YeaH/YhbH (DUF444 family)